MDYNFDDFENAGAESLTFVESDDDGICAATQDSQFDCGNFSLPTQSSQFQSELVSGVESTADLTFQDVDDEEEGSEESLEHTEKVIEHACRYCGISDPLCVAKCTVCSKWFCNAKKGTSGSHIVNHLVKSMHKEVYLHKDSPCGDTQLECYICTSKNIFSLGFIPLKTETVVILCRTPCAQTAAQKDPSWLAQYWKPIISEKQLLSWIVNIPSEDQVLRARNISNNQASRLEDVWRERPDATLDDLDKPGIDCDPDRVMIRYEDAFHYRQIFKPLVALEAKYDEKMKAAQTQSVGQVRWEQGLKKSHLAYFHLPKIDEGTMKLMLGDALRLKHSQTVDGSCWTCEGAIVKLPDNYGDEIGIEVKSEIPKTVQEARIMFTCEIVWNGITFKRQYQALDRLSCIVDNSSENCVSKYLYQKLMGKHVDEVYFKITLPKRLTAPGLPALNNSQLQAVKQSLIRPLSLIQGPPGTGKTVTSATIVYHLVKETKGHVLVCSPSNISVDHLAEKIHKTGLKVVRLCAKSRETMNTNIEFLTLHAQVRTLGGLELKKLIQLKEEIGELEDADHIRYLQLKRVKEHEILAEADVICCTCSTAADSRLSMIRIKTILIDESTQATEPEVLVPIVRGARQLILVGDHCQLGPVVSCKKASNAGLQQSLFERLVLLGNRPHRLQVQYRMHPVLSEFPSNAFYEGSLQNGVTENERKLTGIEWQWPSPDKPTFFWACYGREELSGSGTSFLNRTEAANVEKVVSKLIKSGTKPEQIGVITPYEGQRSFIVYYMKSQGTLNWKLYESLQIASVDAFQGREKDIIIVSCVRSNDTNGIGFLNDPRRLNVTITRAKYGTIMLGNPKVLAKQRMWHDLITWYKKKNLVFEGPISNLKPVNLTLPKPVTNTNLPLTYGIERHNYTYTEYRPSANARAPYTYASGQNFLQHTGAVRDAMANIPVPVQLINPAVFYGNRANQKGRKTQGGHSNHDVMDFSQDMASQSQFMSQASQDPNINLTSGNYEGSLSGWSQSQSQQGKLAGNTQPMSQDIMRDMDDVEQDMAKLLLSQGP